MDDDGGGIPKGQLCFRYAQVTDVGAVMWEDRQASKGRRGLYWELLGERLIFPSLVCEASLLPWSVDESIEDRRRRGDTADGSFLVRFCENLREIGADSVVNLSIRPYSIRPIADRHFPTLCDKP